MNIFSNIIKIINHIHIIFFIMVLQAEDPLEGYTLFTPLPMGPEGFGESYTQLIDNNGLIINSWYHDSPAATTAYLLPDSSLIVPLMISNPYMIGSAYGGRILHYDWHGNIIWEYTYSDTNHLQHHDIEPLDNGNILIIAWDRKTYQEAIDAGREGVEGEMWPDKIVELEPIEQDSANIVWEWKFWDHLIQEIDSTFANYGVVSEHPELIDVNIGEMPLAVMGISDWTHINSIDYNKELDQIALSSRNMSELYIIDHSTTTEEAAGHSGGNSGMGGDILYRWGNPMNYNRGTIDDKILIGQHDVNWIEVGYPGEGNILIFNNGATTGFGENWINSAIMEISTPIDSSGSYFIGDTSYFSPDTLAWFYTSAFFSHIMSGARRLSNGNTLITPAIETRIFEVDENGLIVWEYNHQEEGQTAISKAFKYTDSYFTLSSNYGDINNDLLIDIFDIILLINFILEFETPSEEEFELADINQDGELGIEDVLEILHNILY